jgi:type 1 glutamine amidotransferase
MNRRDFLHAAGLTALALGGARAADKPKRRILMFTRSEGYEHSVVQRKSGKPALAEKIVTDLGGKHNTDVLCEKDGRVFLSKDFPNFDGFLFETQGDLAKEKSKDGAPPVPPEGKKALLDAVAAGKGFVGCHCASDTWHSAGYPDKRWENQPVDKRDPYIRMLGGEFSKHGRQQKAWMRVVDGEFPGMKGVKDFEKLEEWYSLRNFADDIHVILVQDTTGMKDFDYERPNYPATWARKHEKGRVFYTSMGHREDVWESEIFQNLLAGALLWTLGEGNPDLKPNLDKAAPKASELPKMK